MHVVYVGNWTVDWSTESYMARGFEQAGCIVTRFLHPSPALPKAQIIFALGELAEVAAEADLLVYQGAGLPREETSALWRITEQAGCKTASYHLDIFVGLKRQTMLDADPLFCTGTVFTADGDAQTQRVMEKHGIIHRWLPAASDEAEAWHIGTPREEFAHDVVFVGAQHYHPEWPWRPKLINFLRTRYGRAFHLYDHHPPIRGLDLNDLYASAKVVVGDSLALPGHENYWSDRYYETLGRGGCLVAPYVAGIERVFRDGQHLRYYTPGYVADLAFTIDQLLADEPERKQLAECGRAEVLAKHTYRHRAEEMLTVLGLAP